MLTTKHIIIKSIHLPSSSGLDNSFGFDGPRIHDLLIGTSKETSLFDEMGELIKKKVR